MKKMILVVMAVFLMSGMASAATTLDLKGQVRVYPEWNNIGRSAGSIPDYLPGSSYLPASKSSGSIFTDQRARLFFNVKSNENIGGTVALEIDSYWGNTSYDSGRQTGGGLGADSANVEIKNSYLWFTAGDLKITAGIQTFLDDMAGIFVGGGDMAGFRVDYALSKTSSLSTGVYTWWESQATSAGTTKQWKDSVYFIPLTVKQQLGSGTGSLFVYTIQDSTKGSTGLTATQGRRPLAQYDKAQIYYTGFNYGGKAGNVSYYLMGAYNFGTFKDIVTATTDDKKISAFAVNAKVDVKIGDGKLRLNGLYVSGGDSTDKDKYNGFVTGEQYAGAQVMPLLQDDLVIIIGNTDQISNVTTLAVDVNNNNDGLQVAYGAFDYNLSPKLNAKAVLGYASADKQNSVARLGKKMGMEYNAQLKYKFDENLTIAGVGSYAQIGDYFKTAAFDADNAYKLLLKFMYSF